MTSESIEKITTILRLFGKHKVFYEISAPCGCCITASKSAYETYYVCEKVPALFLEQKKIHLTQSELNTVINQIHFYDNGLVMLQENPGILTIESYSPDSWKLHRLKNELASVFPNLLISFKSPWHLKIIFHS